MAARACGASPGRLVAQGSGCALLTTQQRKPPAEDHNPSRNGRGNSRNDHNSKRNPSQSVEAFLGVPPPPLSPRTGHFDPDVVASIAVPRGFHHSQDAVFEPQERYSRIGVICLIKTFINQDATPSVHFISPTRNRARSRSCTAMSKKRPPLSNKNPRLGG